MSSRALYRLGGVIVACTWLIYAAIILAIALLNDLNWAMLLAAFGLAIWASTRMFEALDALRQEANRDTRLGLNGPARQEDLL